MGVARIAGNQYWRLLDLPLQGPPREPRVIRKPLNMPVCGAESCVPLRRVLVVSTPGPGMLRWMAGV